jgi:hypothetical protein
LRILLALLLAAAALLSLADRGLPLVRNSLVYAQRPIDLGRLGTVTDLGQGLLHVVRGG